MSKYVVDTKNFPLQRIDLLGIDDYGIASTTLYTSDLEEVSDEYVKENFSELLADEYRKGQDDIWELIKKIFLSTKDGALRIDVVAEIYGTGDIAKIVRDNTAQGALNKFLDYEKNKAEENNEIKVGDEVRSTITGMTYIVFSIDDDRGYELYNPKYKQTCFLEASILEKTGRHFDVVEQLFMDIKYNPASTTMLPNEFNTIFYPKYSSAFCAIQNMDHAIEKCTDPESMRMQLECTGWNDKTKEFLLEALTCYKEKTKGEALQNFKRRNEVQAEED